MKGFITALAVLLLVGSGCVKVDENGTDLSFSDAAAKGGFKGKPGTPIPQPTSVPTATPIATVTPAPTAAPTPQPTLAPTPTPRPTVAPTAAPTAVPIVTPAPTAAPTAGPTAPPVTPAPTIPSGVVPAFPGAQGGGAGTKGGRGGAIIKVTNLNDSGPGSLRACVAASGPRTCVFTVGGVINLLSTMHVYSPYLTIAGQTAPGGIAIYLGKAPFTPAGQAFAFSIEASDVVIRYLRVWGDTIYMPTAAAATGSIAFSIYEPRVIIDHCDAFWTTQEQLSANVGGGTYGPADLTGQWNLFAEAIYNASNYPNGQSTAIVVQNAATGHNPTGVTDVDFHHNLIASIDHRLPNLVIERGRFINNAVYNFGRMSFMDQLAGSALVKVDFIGNHYKLGPWNDRQGPANPRHREIMADGGSIAWGGTPTFALFVSGNESDFPGYDSYFGDRGTVSSSSSDTIQWSKLTAGSAQYQGPASSGYLPLPDTYKRSPWARLAPPTNKLDITVDNAANLPAILAAPGGVGASKYLSCKGGWINFRDSAQNRVISNYLNATGPSGPPTSAIAANGGALPTLPFVASCADSDGDGMPDAWETYWGGQLGQGTNLIPTGTNFNDGFTNIEHYMNGFKAAP